MSPAIAAVRRALTLMVALAAGAALTLAAPTGAKAATFGIGGTAIPPILLPGGYSRVTALVHQADGKLIVTGTTDGPIARTMFAARFTTAGALDPSYGAGGIFYAPLGPDFYEMEGGGAVLDAGGKLVLAGVRLPLVGPNQPTLMRVDPTGKLDAAFGAGGTARLDVPGYDFGTSVTAAAIDSHGRIVIGGGASDSSAGRGGFLAARLLPDGTPDVSFNGTGYRVLNLSYNRSATSLAIAPSDGVLLAGDPTQFTIVKLTSAGALDGTYGTGGFVNLPDRGPVAFDAAGNAFAAWQGSYPAQDTIFVTRIGANGHADASFGSGGTATVSLSGIVSGIALHAVHVDVAGHVVLAAVGYSGDFGLATIRLNAAGIPDASFGTAGIQFVPTSIASVGGLFLDSGPGNEVFIAGSDYRVVVTRLLASGTPDAAFNGTGTTIKACGVRRLTLTSMARQSDGRFVVAGIADPTAGSLLTSVVARLTTTGDLDPTFNAIGYRTVGAVQGPPLASVALDHGGRVVVVQHDYSGQFYVWRLLADGSFDASFNGTGSLVVADLAGVANPNYNGYHGLALDSHDNILLAGTGVLRLGVTGVLDLGFGVTGRAAIPVITEPWRRIPLAVDGADRVVIGGAVPYNGRLTMAAARLTTTGQPDPGFGAAGVAIAPIDTSRYFSGTTVLAIEGANRVTLAGYASDSSFAWGAVTRFDAAGLPDASFNSGVLTAFQTGISSFSAIALDATGRILLTGSNATGRLLANGSIDPSFNAGQLLATWLAPVAYPLYSNAIVADASDIYVAGTAGHSMAVQKLFDGVPTTLAFLSINGYLDPVAATPFDTVVQARDVAGNPQPVSSPTRVTISVKTGAGALLGPTSCTIPAGSTFCTVTGMAYSIGERVVVLEAVTSSGASLAPAQSRALWISRASATVAIVAHAPDPSAYGQAIVVATNVNGTPALLVPSGGVYVTDGVTTCQFTLPATSCSLTPTVAGPRMLVAGYFGDATFESATSAPVAHTVIPATTFSGPLPGGGTASASFTGGGAGCTFTRARFVPLPPLTAPTGTTISFDPFDFMVSGCPPRATVTITITYPGPIPAGAGLQLYGQPFMNQPPRWIPIAGAKVQGNSITFSLADAANGIDYGLPDGAVGGIAAVAVSLAPPEPIPAASHAALVALAMLLAVMGARRTRALRGRRAG